MDGTGLGAAFFGAAPFFGGAVFRVLFLGDFAMVVPFLPVRESG
jgi:hypothetical protein